MSSLVDGEVVMVEDICTDERWPDLRPVLVQNGIRAIVGAPVHVGKRRRHLLCRAHLS